MKEWSYISTPSMCLHGADKENFAFVLPLYTSNNSKRFHHSDGM